MEEKKPPAKSFEELWIWQKARVIVKHVYEDFGSDSNSAQDFGFRNQIQRAAVSIMNSIAEGFERGSRVDFARFLDIAKASSGDVRSMYYSSEDLAYVNSKTASERRTKLRQISAGIASLALKLRSSAQHS